jgi:hypothetical protein
MEEHICDVCRLLDYDARLKLCTWCGMCKSWICEQDVKNWPRRIRAMAQKKYLEMTA